MARITTTHTPAGKFVTIAMSAMLATALGCGSKSKKAADPTDAKRSAPTEASDTAADSDSAAAGAEKAAPTRNIDLTKTAYFEYDSSSLTETAREKLANNAEWMKVHPDAKLTIEGHTCEMGTAEYNVALGERRARAVRDYLTALGIDGSRISIISYGEERPAGPDLAHNRRAEFVERN